MRLDAEKVAALREQGTEVEVSYNGEVIPNATLVTADDEAGTIERFIGDSVETVISRGVVKIRKIFGLGVQVHESIKTIDRT